MHVGRPYPYHPNYWATEAWFWPGFVPWKMRLQVFDNSDPPWGIYPSGYGEVSVPGMCSSNNKVITYEFQKQSPAYGLILTLQRDIFEGRYVARWQLDLVSSVVTWGRAVELQTYPQRVVFNRTWQYVYGSIPYPVPRAPRYQFDPAAYHVGGSPYPDY